MNDARANYLNAKHGLVDSRNVPGGTLDNGLNRNGFEPYQEFARRIGVVFDDWLLLNRALTHRSYLNEHPEALEDNERLEFLGDAVLDFVVGSWLYHRFPEMAEGDLTRMRSALVYTDQLANFARRIDIGRAMKLGRGELTAGGNTRSPLLCDAFEALIGAIYLDKGIQMVMKFISSFLEDTVDDIIVNHKIDDPKSQLQERVQSQGYPPPKYVVRGTSGPEHEREFTVDVMVKEMVLGTGSGSSKQLATKSAARDALEHLDMLNLHGEAE